MSCAAGLAAILKSRLKRIATFSILLIQKNDGRFVICGRSLGDAIINVMPSSTCATRKELFDVKRERRSPPKADHHLSQHDWRIAKRLCCACACLSLSMSCAALQEARSQGVTANATARAPDAAKSLFADIERWLIDMQPELQIKKGLRLAELPDLSLEQSQIDARQAEAFSRSLNSIDVSELQHRDELTRRFLLAQLANIRRGPERFKYETSVTPYAVVIALGALRQYAGGAPLDTDGARDDYLTFLSAYADLIGQIEAKLQFQAQAGILTPRPALGGVRETWRRIAAAKAEFQPSDERLGYLDAQDKAAFQNAVDASIGAIADAYDSLIAALGPDYEARAPLTVGLRQYEGGEAFYRTLIKRYTGYESRPEDLHAIGLERMKGIQEEMATIREQIGYAGEPAQFFDHLKDDPRFIAKDVAELEARYSQCLERIEPKLAQYFEKTPEAPYGVARVDPANEAGLSFGFYQAPTPTAPRGLYRFNGSNLEEKPTLKACPLIYHELVPGHHFQIALQQESARLPEARRYASGLYVSAYIEGWAEYASILGYEMGLYDDPYVRYGRLSMDASATARLVVDTGLNGLGWSLEEARRYLRDHTTLSAREIETESLRYATDIPGQALAYSMGPLKLLEFRERAQSELGDAFDLRDFHDAILEPGPLPLDILEYQVSNWIDETSKAQAD